MARKKVIRIYREPAGGWGALKATGEALALQGVAVSGAKTLLHMKLASNATSHVHRAFEMPGGNTQPLLGSGISIKHALHRKNAYYICEREPHTAFQPTCRDRQQCVHRDFRGRNKSPEISRGHTSVTAVATHFPSIN